MIYQQPESIAFAAMTVHIKNHVHVITQAPLYLQNQGEQNLKNGVNYLNKIRTFAAVKPTLCR